MCSSSLRRSTYVVFVWNGWYILPTPKIKLSENKIVFLNDLLFMTVVVPIVFFSNKTYSTHQRSVHLTSIQRIIGLLKSPREGRQIDWKTTKHNRVCQSRTKRKITTSRHFLINFDHGCSDSFFNFHHRLRKKLHLKLSVKKLHYLKHRQQKKEIIVAF